MTAAIESLERKWQLPLPPAYHRLYESEPRPVVGSCEFVSIQGLLADEERWFGMLPQFLPFGDDGGDNLFGFYVAGNPTRRDYPVLFWDHEYDHYLPVASAFAPFLAWCRIQSAYAEEDNPASAPESAIETTPRNERELYERVASLDPQSAQALAQLGSFALGRADIGRARDFFARASESAPWFADPYYVLGETYRLEDRIPEALERWWQVVHCPIALSTRTGNYDLGEDHPDMEVYEAALEELLAYSDMLEPERRGCPLGMLLLEGNAFEPAERLALADVEGRAGDLLSDEREALNALTLATEDADAARAYERLIFLYERTGRQREAHLCRSDSKL